MQASKLKKLHKSRELLPRQSERVILGDINLVAKRAVRLGLCPEGWWQDASITINHPDGRKSKAGLTRAKRPKISINTPVTSFMHREEVVDSLSICERNGRPSLAARRRRWLKKMDIAGTDFIMLEYEAIALDEAIGEFAFQKSQSRYAHGAVICHEMAHAITYSQTDHAARALGLKSLEAGEKLAHQRLWQEIYRMLRVDFLSLLDRHYLRKLKPSIQETVCSKAETKNATCVQVSYTLSANDRLVTKKVEKALKYLEPYLERVDPKREWSKSTPENFVFFAGREIERNHDWQLVDSKYAWKAHDLIYLESADDDELARLVDQVEELALTLAQREH